MELDSATISSVWWKGALGGAAKGILQGLLLGLGGALMLWGLAAAFPALGLATVFHGFLFTSAVEAATLTINPIGFIALNTVLTIAGNFLTSGQSAVNAYKQDVEHRMNDARITAIEQREQMREPTVAPSRAVQKILAQGPRNRDNFEAAETEREASAPSSPTIH